MKKIILTSLLAVSLFSAEYPKDTEYLNEWAKKTLHRLPFGLKVGVSNCDDVKKISKLHLDVDNNESYIDKDKDTNIRVWCHDEQNKVSSIVFYKLKYARKSFKPLYIGGKKSTIEKRALKIFGEDEILEDSNDLSLIYLTDDVRLELSFYDKKLYEIYINIPELTD